MQITAAMVKELRERTQAGMMDCKNALVETKGDMEKAIEYLREKGLAANAKKAGRVAAEGMVDSYIHMGGKIGVLVEVNCETDFVANTDAFRSLCHDLALQIAASNPLFVSKEDVPAENLDKEREILRAQALNEGKPEKIVDRMVEGRIEKYYKEVCLLEQPFVKNPDITVQTLVNETALASGEKISVRRFTRYERGEGIERKVSDLASEIEEMTAKA
ncbi:MAG: translation elongation factor Ts [Clostridiales bacterium]|nr:translation elongation factor Ts [Clostridiales bacterium]